MTALFGGAFDPPHNGHVALARGAIVHFGLDSLTVLVGDAPGHKEVVTPVETRLRLAKAAFPDRQVMRDPHARTVDMLREGRWDDPLLLVGADELVDFPAWKEPAAVLELARLGVAMRPGYERERVEDARARLSRPDRVEVFEIEPVPVESREIRARVARGESIAGLVPAAVAHLIEELGLYRERGRAGLHLGQTGKDPNRL